MVLWQEPKKLGEKVRIKDESSEHYNRIGYKQASRICDDKVLIFFYVTKRKGEMKEFDWSQCERCL